MIWETRGSALYGTCDGSDYLITRDGSMWALRTRSVGDARWHVVSEYRTQHDAMAAVGRSR